MTEILVLGLFVLGLLSCLSFGLTVIYALVLGFFLFFGYGLYKGHSFRAMGEMALEGVKSVKYILTVFCFVGAVTGLWRACGTIPYIVSLAVDLFDPRYMVLISFFLCSMLSLLTGTALGTAATMGVICASVANSMGISPILTGGAVMSGCFLGDRCSPMSTSALLVSSVTKTDLYRNIGRMIKSGAVPLVLACVIYLVMGFSSHSGSAGHPVQELFAAAFVMHPTALIPAAAVVVLAFFRVKPRTAMGVSIVCALLVGALVQKLSPAQLVYAALLGYHPEDAELAALLSGGGVRSMMSVFCIVCISSTYSGMFNGTGLLQGFRGKITKLSRHILPFGCIFLTSIVSNMIACSQPLAIMLTQQLCSEAEPDNEKMALALENTAVVICPLVPWTVACSVTSASVGTPPTIILAACYLYLLPLWNYFVAFIKHKRSGIK